MACPYPSSALFDLVCDRDWNTAVSHVNSRPIDAAFQDGDCDETPLYLACQLDPPVEAISAIVAAYPSVVSLPQTRNRDCPLHIACRYRASTKVLRVLVEADSRAVLALSKWGATPLTALCDGFAAAKSHGMSVDEDTQWERIELILMAIDKQRKEDCMTNHRDGEPLPENRAMSVFHAIARLGPRLCPRRVLRLAVSRRATLSSLSADKTRRSLPFHSFLSAPFCHRQEAKNRSFFGTFLNILRCDESSPSFEGIAHSGRSSLHVALVNGHSWFGGVELLVKADPGAIERKDPVSLLYPFMMSATDFVDGNGCCKKDAKTVETTFMLLSARPHVLAGCLLDQQQREVGDTSSREQRKIMIHESACSRRGNRIRNEPVLGMYGMAVSVAVVSALVVGSCAAASKRGLKVL